MSVVTDEMVEKAARAVFMRGWVTPNGFASADDFFTARKEHNPIEWGFAVINTRAALAAVAPIIAKAAREQVMQVLAMHEAGYAKSCASYQAAANNEMVAFVGAKETALGVALLAIRALGDAT